MLDHIHHYNDHKINNYKNFKIHLLSIYYQKWNNNIIDNIKNIYNSEFKEYIYEIFKDHQDFKNYILKDNLGG